MPSDGALVLKSGFTYQLRVHSTPVTADAFAVAVPTKAAQVSAQFDSGPNRRFGVQALTSQQAKKAGVERFSYAVFALDHQACISRLVATNRAGEMIAHADEEC